jgi:tetratricopeptide (TPR) repeat protein
MNPEPMKHAWELLQQAFRAQMEGELDLAVKLYRSSLEICPTAEAHTFLGWTYHFQGKTLDAIAECKRAIEVDPDFGNPYNDIGSYLIELGRLDEAIPWLERAIAAPRYDPRHFPYFNLGRAYFAKGEIRRARGYFEESLRIEPNYTLARQAIEKIRRMMN